MPPKGHDIDHCAGSGTISSTTDKARVVELTLWPSAQGRRRWRARDRADRAGFVTFLPQAVVLQGESLDDRDGEGEMFRELGDVAPELSVLLFEGSRMELSAGRPGAADQSNGCG